MRFLVSMEDLSRMGCPGMRLDLLTQRSKVKGELNFGFGKIIKKYAYTSILKKRIHTFFNTTDW